MGNTLDRVKCYVEVLASSSKQSSEAITVALKQINDMIIQSNASVREAISDLKELFNIGFARLQYVVIKCGNKKRNAGCSYSYIVFIRIADDYVIQK